MKNNRSLSEDKRLSELITIDRRADSVNIFDSVYRKIHMRLYASKWRYKINGYSYKIEKRNISKIMDIISSAEISVWVKKRNTYELHPLNDFFWVHSDSISRNISKIACELWRCLDKYPDLKNDILKKEGYTGLTNPVSIGSLPKDIKANILSLIDNQKLLDANYKVMETGNIDNYSIKLTESVRGGDRKGYSLDVFEQSATSSETFSTAMTDNSYKQQEQIELFLKQNQKNLYKNNLEPVSAQRRKAVYNEKQLFISGLKLDYDIKKMNIYEILEIILHDNKLEYFIKEHDDESIADVRLAKCCFSDFLDCVFTNKWNICPEGTVIIGSTRPGLETPPSIPGCIVKFYPPGSSSRS